MKLLVIVLCLLNERYLVHASAHNRFRWFSLYRNFIINKVSHVNPWLELSLLVLPLVLVSWLIFYLFSGWFFGVVGLLLNIIVFYYCLGPDNAFFPLRSNEENLSANFDLENYFINVNGQVFAIIFWYVLLGPLAIIAYRLVALSQNYSNVSNEAKLLTNIFDWLPARITAFLYLLVGNFQSAVSDYTRLFFTSFTQNDKLLSSCGVKALGNFEQNESLPRAEILVEHAIIVLLVLMAFFTLTARF